MNNKSENKALDLIYRGAMTISAMALVYIVSSHFDFRDDQIKWNNETSKLLVKIVSQMEHQGEKLNSKNSECKERCSQMYKQLDYRLRRLERK